MATVDQLLRQFARQSGSVPYWVLEKDYALSYLLAGIVATPALHDSLILKGGTALRKGYFDDYRFSEDLDFSLQPDRSLSDVDDAVQHAVGHMERLLLQRGPFEASVERLTLLDPHPGSFDLWQILRRSKLEPNGLPELVLEKCRHRNVPFDKPDAFFAPELLELAHAEWDRLLRPFVPHCPAAQQVLDDLPSLVFDMW